MFVSHETYTPARGGSAAAEVEALRGVFGEAARDIVVANTKGYTGHAMGVGVEDVLEHLDRTFDPVKDSRIKLVFLPPYAPNLNLIVRLWKFFKKNILYNRYYASFDEFRAACEEFFSNPRKYHQELRSLLTENFAIIGE